jgi:hypothetical protein
LICWCADGAARAGRLFIAAEAGRVDVVRSLLASGANVNLATAVQDDHGGARWPRGALLLLLLLFDLTD